MSSGKSEHESGTPRMPELRQSREMPTGRHDQLLGLYQELSRAIDTILRSVIGLPVDMRQSTLRVARELLLAQSYVIDKLAGLSEIEPTFAGGFAGPDQHRPQAPSRPATTTQHQPITAWLNQNALDPGAGLADTGPELARGPTNDHRQIETFGSSDGLDVANLTPPGTLSDTVSQVGGLGAIAPERRRQDDPSNMAKLDRVATELQQRFTDHLARLPSTIVDHDVDSRASSFQSNHHDVHGTFIAILQSGHAYASNNSASERVRSATLASQTASSRDAPAAATRDETQWLDGEIASPTTRLRTAIGRILGRGSHTGPMIAKLGVAAMAGASLMFWLGAPGAPRSAQPAGSASSGPEETRGAPVVATAPFAKVAAAPDQANTTPPTDAPQQAAALQEKFQSRLSPSVVAPLAAAHADPSAGERRASASENALESRTTSAPVIEPPRNVPSTLSSGDLATPRVGELRALAPVHSLSAPTPTTPVMKPPRNIPSMASADLATSQISGVQTGSEPSHAQKAKPTLQKPTHEEAPARQSSQPTSLALEPKPVVAGTKTSKTWQTASVAVVAGHFAPVLVTLRDKAAALQIFEDLQKRHAAALANKKAELRSFVGPDGQTWYHVVALPAVTEAEATAVCHSLGSEGEALDCSVAPY